MPYTNYKIDTSKRNDWLSVISQKAVEKYLKKTSKSIISEDIPQIFVMTQDHISNRIILNGIYERRYLDAAMKLLIFNKKIHGSVVDAGANIGNHSLYFSKYYNSVYSFEPNPKIFKVLLANSRLTDNIKCFELGLSDSDSDETLHIINSYNLGESSIDPKIDYVKSSSYEIKTIRLEDAVEVSNDKIGLIKIDVENFETQVINGARSIIERDSPIIFFEQHDYDFPTDGGDSTCIKSLREIGYNNFYEVDLFPRFNSIKYKHVRNILQHIVRTISGYTYKISKVDKFDRRFYSFIIASKDELAINYQ